MTSGVAGKVIAITGVSSGIGRACARSLACLGTLVTALTDALAGKWTR